MGDVVAHMGDDRAGREPVPTLLKVFMPVYIGFLNRIFGIFLIFLLSCLSSVFSNFDRFEPGTAVNEMQHLLSEDSFPMTCCTSPQ